MKPKEKFVIIITLLIIIICIYLLIFFVPTCCGPPTLDAIKNKACTELVKSDCKTSTYYILTEDFDANKDGKFDEKDTLFELCKNYYGLRADADCKRIGCGCT